MNTPHLDIDAHVVHQLGEELITDAEQALLELVKNSYDADAKWCNVIIDTKYSEETTLKRDSVEEHVILNGRITVEDGGCGMTEDQIKQGWLTISISPKRIMKQKGEKTPIYQRTPLGDKGLGRLGTMKLGNRLAIYTHHSPDEHGYKVILFWNDCKSGRPLTSVPIEMESIPPTGKTGTTIEICGLSDIAYWTGEEQIKDLTDKISTLLSPFKEFQTFTVSVTCDDKQIQRTQFSNSFLESAMSHFELIWDNELLDLSGKLKLDIFEGDDPDFFQYHIWSDSGKDFYSFLENHRIASRLSISKSHSPKWFISFNDKVLWNEIVSKGERNTRTINPGPFTAEFYGFVLKDYQRKITEMARDIGSERENIKDLFGIYIYRDNFRIRVPGDWLKLGEAWTRGRSYYSLRPANTVGYFAVNSSDNPELIEKSDREGFVDNAARRGFYAIAERFRKFANDSSNLLRRAYNEYRDAKKMQESEQPRKMSAEEGTEQIAELINLSRQIANSIKDGNEKRVVALRKTKEQINQLMSDKLIKKDLKEKFEHASQEIENLAMQMKNEASQMQSLLNEFSAKGQYIDLIKERFMQLNYQITEVYETVGIGLAAQALTHEVHPFIDDLLARIRAIQERLEELRKSDPKTVRDLELIKLQAQMIGKKMAYMDPMLRTFRETKQNIQLEEFVSDFFDLKRGRLDRFNIKTFVKCKQDINLKMNRGRLTQILDNLTRNSEYWLRQLDDSESQTLEIHVDIDAPRVVFWDTGPGVRPPLEEVLFDIFVSDKPRGEGHGLGLYIVKQLLEEEGCRIYLDDERNLKGRRFRFIIDFTGVIDA